MKLSDYHIHTKYCHHATGEMEEYVGRAVEIGLTEMGFADHVPVDDGYDPAHRMLEETFPVYIDTIQQLRESYPHIKIWQGLEIDFYPGFERSLEKVLHKYSIEYMIGSVHFLDGKPVFSKKEMICTESEATDFIRQYFSELQKGVQSKMLNVVGHSDVVKWNFSHRMDLIYRCTQDLYDEVQKAGLAIELNTSGLRRKPKEMYPAKSILQLAVERKIPVILGSDAHQPEHVGADFDLAVDVLKSIGYSDYRPLPCGLLAFHNPAVH